MTASEKGNGIERETFYLLKESLLAFSMHSTLVSSDMLRHLEVVRYLEVLSSRGSEMAIEMCQLPNTQEDSQHLANILYD